MFKWKVDYTFRGKKRVKTFESKAFFNSFLELLDKEIEKGNCGGYEFRRVRNYNRH